MAIAVKVSRETINERHRIDRRVAIRLDKEIRVAQIWKYENVATSSLDEIPVELGRVDMSLFLIVDDVDSFFALLAAKRVEDECVVELSLIW